MICRGRLSAWFNVPVVSTGSVKKRRIFCAIVFTSGRRGAHHQFAGARPSTSTSECWRLSAQTKRFFEDDRNELAILDLYNERAGLLDDELDNDVDLAS